MNGKLVKSLGEWFVKYDNDGHIVLYPLCPQTLVWVNNPLTQKFIKEDIEVVFSLIVKGEYCETKEMLLKNYQAKITSVDHETI
jgi:hypothetical protein